jgi:peptide/nickel transport system substrate-binding protein
VERGADAGRGLPKVSADGKTYTITLRKGVKLHNGRELTPTTWWPACSAGWTSRRAARPWARKSPSLKAKGPHWRSSSKLKNPYAPLLAQLALPSGMAAIMAKERSRRR